MTLRDIFCISTGAAVLYCNRVLDAMMHLQPMFIKWHCASEKSSMSNRMNVKGFPMCVDIMDRTLFLLQQQPEQSDYVDFSNRHQQYSLSTMIVCNDCCQILFHDSGWHGSVHDQCVFKGSKIFNNTDKYLKRGEYIIADAGYANTNHIITSYKLSPGESSLPQPRAFFNRVHASARVRVEHTIGLLKGLISFSARNPYQGYRRQQYNFGCYSPYTSVYNSSQSFESIFQDRLSRLDQGK
jgi:hypothetical protein